MLDIPWVVNAQAGQSATTQAVTIDASTADTYLISGGTMLKNGNPVSSGSAFAAGDTLAVQAVAPAVPGQALWVYVTGSFDVSVSAIVTAETIERRVYSNMQQHEALDLTFYPNSAPFRPNNARNALIDVTKQVTYNLNYLAGQLTPATSILVLNDALNNRVLFIDANTKGLLKTLTFDEKPRGPFLQKLLPTDTVSFALYKAGQVVSVRLSDFSQSVVSAYAPTSACTANGVTAITDDVFLNIGEGASYNLGHKIHKAVAFGSNWAVTSDAGLHLVVGGVVTQVLSEFCRDVCSNGQYAYAVAGNKVYRFDAAGNSLSLDLDTSLPAFPVSVAANSTQVAVGAFNNKAYVMNTDLSGLSATACADPYGVSFTDSLYAASLYYNRPDPTYLVNKTPLSFDLADPVRSARNTQLTSNTFVVELPTDVSVTASVPSLWGMSIVKNGQPAGSSVVVANGDQLAVKVTTPTSQNTLMRAPLAVGEQYDYLQTETLAYDVTPTYFKLADAKSPTPGAVVVSEEVTINGLDSDQSASISISMGTLYKNGVALTQSYAQFSNGDKIKVSAASGSAGTTQYVVITMGTSSTYWALTTAYPSAQKYLPADLLLIDEQLLPYSDSADVRKLFRATKDLSSTAEVDLGGTYSVPSDGSPAIVVADIRAGKLHSVTQRTFLPQATLSVPGVVSSDVVPKVFSTLADYTMLAVTANKISLYDKDFAPIWSVGTPTPTLDALFVGAATLYLLDAQGYSKYSVDLTTGALTLVWTHAGSFSRFYYARATNKSEYAFVAGADGVVLISDTPVTISATSSVNVAIDADNQLVWSYDRYAGDLLEFDFTGTPVRSAHLYFVAGDLLYAEALYVSDLSGRRLVQLDSSLAEAAHVSTNALLVDLTCDDTYVYGFECLSTVLDSDFITQSSPDASFPDSTGVPVGRRVDSATQKIDSTAAVRPRQVSIPPIAGAQIVLNGQPVGTSSTVSAGDTVGLEVYSTSTYLETETLGLHMGDSLYSWSITTVPNLIPDYLQFAGQFGLTIGDEAVTEALPISGLSAGVSTTLTLDVGTTEGYILVNGVASGQSATVTNGDQVSLALTVQGVYGFAHAYTIGSSGVTVGSVRITTKFLADPFVRPEQEEKDGQSFMSHLTHRVSVELAIAEGVPLKDEWYLCDKDVGTACGSGTQTIAGLDAEVEKFNNMLRGLPTAQTVAGHVRAGQAKEATRVFGSELLGIAGTPDREERAVQQAIKGSPSRVTQASSRSVASTPLKGSEESSHRVSADYAYRLLNYTAVSSGLPFRERAHMSLVQAVRLDAKHLEADGFFMVDAQYKAEQGRSYDFDRWSFDQVRNTEVVFKHDPVRHYWTNEAIPTRWARVGLRTEQDVTASYATAPARTYMQARAEYAATSATQARSSLHDWAADEQTSRSFPASAGTRAVHALPKAALNRALRRVGNASKILISGYARPSWSARSWIKRAASKEIAALKSSPRYSMKLVLTPVWVEPTLTSADALGIFDTQAQAQADADAKAVNPTHVTAFHTHFFWYQDPTVANKVCMTVGHMDRTPYRWNMQMDNVFAADKLSWYLSGG